MSCLRYLCVYVYSGVQHILLCFCFVFLRLVYPMLSVSLHCPFDIALRYSLTFIYIKIALFKCKMCDLQLYDDNDDVH